MYHWSSMNREAAEAISRWQYPKPYDLYNSGSDLETIAEFMAGEYFCAYDDSSSLAGFCCRGLSAQVPAGIMVNAYADPAFLDIGLGMRPDLVGRGLGYHYVGAVIDFFSQPSGTTGLRLTVARFNQRAMVVYQRHHFVAGLAFSGHGIEFLTMQRRAHPL